MILRVKLLLLWLLAIAIPVQGVAAVWQPACGMDMPAQVRTMQDAAPAHPHHDHHAMAAPDAASALHHTVSVASADHHANCGHTCAACHTGALLPALMLPPAPALPSRTCFLPPATGVVGYTPDNPDRPPSRT